MDKATDTYVRKEDTRIPNMSDEIKKKMDTPSDI